VSNEPHIDSSCLTTTTHSSFAKDPPISSTGTLLDYNIQKESLSTSFFICVVECRFSCPAPARFRITTSKRSLHLVLRLRGGRSLTLHLVLRLCGGMQIFLSSIGTLSDYNIPKESPPCSSFAWGKISVKTLTSPPRLRLRSGMQIFVKHRHAFGLQHPKGVISTLFFVCVGEDPLLLHLVLCLHGGMQIFVKHRHPFGHTFGLQHPKGVISTLVFVCVGDDPLLLHLVLRLRSGMQIFVKHRHPFGHTFGLQHPKGVTTFVLCLRRGRSLTSPPRSSSARWNADFCQAPAPFRAHFRITTSKRSHHPVLHLRRGRSLTSPLLLHLILHLRGGMQIFVSSTSMHGRFPPLLHLPLYAP